MRGKFHEVFKGALMVCVVGTIAGFLLVFFLDLSFALNATQTVGVYLGVNHSAEYEDDTWVKVRFSDASGVERTETMFRTIAMRDLTPGDTLSIVYDSSNPKRVRVDKFSEL